MTCSAECSAHRQSHFKSGLRIESTAAIAGLILADQKVSDVDHAVSMWWRTFA